MKTAEATANQAATFLNPAVDDISAELRALAEGAGIGGIEAGAYTRSHFSSASAVPDTHKHPTHPKTPYHPLNMGYTAPTRSHKTRSS